MGGLPPPHPRPLRQPGPQGGPAQRRPGGDGEDAGAPAVVRAIRPGAGTSGERPPQLPPVPRLPRGDS